MPRLLVIGDIHGCCKALRTLSAHIGLRADDTLITLGDYVNKGPESREVLDFLLALSRSLRLIPIQGNHDLLMRGARNSELEYRAWLNADGDATLRSYGKGKPGKLTDIPQEHWDFLDNQLVPCFETDTHLFVHAGLQPDLPLNLQPESILYWQKFTNPPAHQSGKIMICGHTAQKSGLPVVTRHALCLDTWVAGKGWLSCLDIEAGMVVQANQQGQIRKFFLTNLEEHPQSSSGGAWMERSHPPIPPEPGAETDSRTVRRVTAGLNTFALEPDSSFASGDHPAGFLCGQPSPGEPLPRLGG